MTYQLIVTPIDMACTVTPDMMEDKSHTYVIEGDYGYCGSFPTFNRAWEHAQEECRIMREHGHDVEVARNE